MISAHPPHSTRARGKLPHVPVAVKCLYMFVLAASDPLALLSLMSQLSRDTPPALGSGTLIPPRAAQSSPLPAQELQDTHPTAAPPLLKGRGLGRG